MKTIRRKNTSEASKPPPPCRVRQYAEDVLVGRVIAGPHVRNACRRHMEDLARGGDRGLIWDPEAAERVFGFFGEALRLSQGKFEGRPFLLEPAQAFILGSLFGWKTGEGRRRFRRAFIETGKGNGKSPFAAGVGMYCLVADGEARAEVYAAASMKAQAMVTFRAAVAMWEQSPALRRRLTKSGGNPVWNLADLKTGSFFRPISSEEGFSGPLPSCALCDEVHEHRDGMMIEMLERGFKSRENPLLLMITNSGSNRNSVCWQEHQHAVRVAAGTMTPDDDFTWVGEAIDDTSFSYVCSLDKGDDPLEDEGCWIKANPLLGVTMPVEELRRAVAQAKAIPGKLNQILRLHFCKWTDAERSWMSRSALEPCLADFDPEVEHAGKEVVAAVDLSATRDLTAMAFVVENGFKEVAREEGGRAVLPTYDLWIEAWTPADTLTQRAREDETPYDEWVRDGFLNATPGKYVRYDIVAAHLAALSGVFHIRALGYDAYAFHKHFAPELDELGLTIPLVEHPQGGKRKAAESGLWMPGSKDLLERLIMDGRIRLRRSPVLIAAFMSAAVETDPAGNSWFSKRRATARIDPLVASAMAVGVAASGDGGKEKSFSSFWNNDAFLAAEGIEV